MSIFNSGLNKVRSERRTSSWTYTCVASMVAISHVWLLSIGNVAGPNRDVL